MGAWGWPIHGDFSKLWLTSDEHKQVTMNEDLPYPQGEDQRVGLSFLGALPVDA
jgi:hypothetical protein